MAEPKDDRKGAEPKDDRKGAEPKDDRKGEPAGAGAGGCGNDGAALHILQSAAQLCGFLVVAVVAPMSGGGRSHTCSSEGSPRRYALSELSRKAEAKQREAQFRPSPSPTQDKSEAPAPPQSTMPAAPAVEPNVAPNKKTESGGRV